MFFPLTQIFTKLCQICTGTESDQVKKNRKKIEAFKVKQITNSLENESLFMVVLLFKTVFLLFVENGLTLSKAVINV